MGIRQIGNVLHVKKSVIEAVIDPVANPLGHNNRHHNRRQKTKFPIYIQDYITMYLIFNSDPVISSIMTAIVTVIRPEPLQKAAAPIMAHVPGSAPCSPMLSLTSPLIK